MKSRSINLFQAEEISPAEKKKTFALRIGTIFLIVSYLLIVIAVFSYWLVTEREAKLLTGKIRTEKTKITELQEIESLQALLKQRLSSLSKIVEIDKLNIKDKLNYLEDLLPEGVIFEQVHWSAGGKVSLSGLAANALVLSDYLDTLKEETDKKKIAKSTLLSAARDEGGLYKFNLEILLKPE